MSAQPVGRWHRVVALSASGMPVADTPTDRRASALVQHQQVMDEAAQIARVAAQAHRLVAAAPVFASQTHGADVRERVNWVQSS